MSRKSKLAPRNPLVAAGLFRNAGAHEKPHKVKRRDEKLRTRREADAGAGGSSWEEIPPVRLGVAVAQW